MGEPTSANIKLKLFYCLKRSTVCERHQYRTTKCHMWHLVYFSGPCLTSIHLCLVSLKILTQADMFTEHIAVAYKQKLHILLKMKKIYIRSSDPRQRLTRQKLTQILSIRFRQLLAQCGPRVLALVEEQLKYTFEAGHAVQKERTCSHFTRLHQYQCYGKARKWMVQ